MEKKIVYRQIALEEINDALLKDDVRRQAVTQIWKKANGEWRTVDHPFVDDWSDEVRKQKVEAFRGIVRSGGYLVGAFAEGKLKGFAAVECTLLGSRRQYAELSLPHAYNGMGQFLE